MRSVVRAMKKVPFAGDFFKSALDGILLAGVKVLSETAQIFGNIFRKLLKWPK